MKHPLAGENMKAVRYRVRPGPDRNPGAAMRNPAADRLWILRHGHGPAGRRNAAAAGNRNGAAVSGRAVTASWGCC